MNNLAESRHNLDDGDLDIKRYFGLFLSNWYWFVLFLFCAGLLAYGVNTYSERVYAISSSLLIKDDQSSDFTGMDRIMPGGDIFRSQQNLQNEIGILKSFEVNYKVIEELPDFHVTIMGLGKRGIAQIRQYKSAPFMIAYDSLNIQRIGVPVSIKLISSNSFTLEISGSTLKNHEYFFGQRFNEAGFNFIIERRDGEFFDFNPNLSNKYVFWFNRLESVANSYRGKLNINPVNEEASLLNLSISGASPMQEADYLNKLMDVYIRQVLDYKNETATNTIEFIDNQLKLISDSLTEAEDKLENFRYENKLIDLSSEGVSIKKRLEAYTQEKVTADLQKQYFVYLSEYLGKKDESGEIISPSIMGITDALLIQLVDELSKLQSQKRQLRYNLIGDQPAFHLMDSKIEDKRIALNENVQNNINNINRSLNDIEQRIKKVDQELSKLPKTERRFINIQRKFDLNNTVYTYMLEKRSEASIAKASKVSGNRIIDRAIPYNSSVISPKTRKNYMLAIIFGLLIPGLYILLVDQLHNKIFDKKDIERGTDVPIIGFIGHNSSNSEIPVKEKLGSSLAESFRTIRTNLKYYLNGEKKAVISITSTLSGEGKTFISLNLAAALSMLGKKTLIIGVDLRKPRLNKILYPESEIGLSTYLIGESDINSVIVKTTINNLYFVPSGPIPPNPSELLESEKMRYFMNKAIEMFDFIVLDTPPVGVVSDALLLRNYSDVNIFVIRQKYSYKSTLELIQSIYEKKELKNLTIAVNDIHIAGYYGYGLRYGYGFYQGYGYNYGYKQYGSYSNDYYKYYKE